MSLFGKILLVFNLLAGGAFAYFAMQNYFGEKGKGNGRQAITAGAIRHILLLRGVPIGGEKQLGSDGKPEAGLDDPLDMPTDPEAEVPLRLEMAGGYPTKTISVPLLKSYFQLAGDGGPLGGGPVPNQLAELKRVRAKVEEMLKAAEGAAKLKLLVDFMEFQPVTYDERVAVQELIKASNTEELEKRLLAKFTALMDSSKAPDMSFAAEPLPDVAKIWKELEDLKVAKAGPSELEAKQKELTDAEAKVKERTAKVAEARMSATAEAERRAKIAHLLMHLSRDEAWQKRVMIVVGVRQYAAAIVAQVERFRDMSRYVKDMIEAADQVGHLSHVLSLMGLAEQRTIIAEQQAALKKQWADRKAKEDDFVAERTTQLNNIKAQLKKTKAEVEELLVKQGVIEANLFEVQREVAVTLDEVYLLFTKLAARERDLLGLPPKPVEEK